MSDYHLEYGTGTAAPKIAHVCSECEENDIHLVGDLLSERLVYCPSCHDYVEPYEKPGNSDVVVEAPVEPDAAMAGAEGGAGAEDFF